MVVTASGTLEADVLVAGEKIAAVLARAVTGEAGEEAAAQAMQEVREFEELDLHLLASDLPIDAYLDRGFQNWLRTTFDY